MYRLNRRSLVVSSAAVAASVSVGVSAHQATPAATPVSHGLQARLVDSVILPNEHMVDDTLYGGISGIDYDPVADAWYLISDDRSEMAPARFYTASIAYDDNGFTEVTIDSAVTLLQGDGNPFPSWEEGGVVVDPESIRKDPHENVLWWTSEGSQEPLLDPTISISNLDGSLVSTFSLPAPFEMDESQETGPRDNHNFEGLSFSPDGETLWIGVEHPLHQDGPEPSPDHNSWVRLINMDRAGLILREFAIELDPIDAPDDAQYLSHGMSEILVVDDHRLLCVDRVTIADKDWAFENYIRIWELDITGATDIHGVESLVDAEFTPVTRRLLIDLNDAGLFPIDNIEAMTFGPNLPNGNRALLLANDNNFDFETQIQQIVLLEITGE